MINCRDLMICMIILFLVTGCATSTAQKPDWIVKPPQDKLYYTGIGFSNTGVQGTDREIARKAAIAEMSASISTSISGEITLNQRDSSDGNNFQEISRRIAENITHSLEGIAIHDSYYSPRDGYWIYVRLSRLEFEKQKQRLRDRVLGVVDSSDESDIPQTIANLAAGINLLYESPYFASIKDTTGDLILVDRLENELNVHIRELTIQTEERMINALPGKSFPLKLVLTYKGKGITGLPVEIRAENNNAVKTVYTGNNGRFDGDVELALGTGEHTVNAQLDLESLHIPVAMMKNKPSPVRRSFIVKIDQLKARLVFTETGARNVPGIRGMVNSLFSRSGFPLSFTPENAPLTVDTELIIEDFPRYQDNALFISQARIIIKLIKGANTIYTYESLSQKDGGATLAQSHERTVKKLFRELEKDTSYIDGINTHLGVD